MAGSRGTRMAGEELTKAQQRERARERIANDPERTAERLSGVDRDKYDFGDYSDKDIVMAMQGSSFGDEDYARLTGKSIDKPEDPKPEPTPEPSPDPTPEPDPTPVKPQPSPGPEKPPYVPPTPPMLGHTGSQTQNVNQDNDINSTVTGSNNTVTNNQDNSVGQYGAYGSAANRSKSLRDKYVADVSRFVRG